MTLDRPSFRRDLEAVPFEVDGQGFVEVRDPTTGGSFQFYELEYRVALAFDGLSFDQVRSWLKLAAGMEFQEDQLRAFAVQLQELGFLESSATGLPVGGAAVEGEGPLEDQAALPEPAENDEQGWQVSEEPAEPVSPPAARALEEVALPLPGDSGQLTPLPTEVLHAVPAPLSQPVEEAEPPLQAAIEAEAWAPQAQAEEAAPLAEPPVEPVPVIEEVPPQAEAARAEPVAVEESAMIAAPAVATEAAGVLDALVHGPAVQDEESASAGAPAYQPLVAEAPASAPEPTYEPVAAAEPVVAAEAEYEPVAAAEPVVATEAEYEPVAAAESVVDEPGQSEALPASEEPAALFEELFAEEPAAVAEEFATPGAPVYVPGEPENAVPATEPEPVAAVANPRILGGPVYISLEPTPVVEAVEEAVRVAEPASQPAGDALAEPAVERPLAPVVPQPERPPAATIPVQYASTPSVTAKYLDSSAFPVLPTPPPQSVGRTPPPVTPPPVTPPPVAPPVWPVQPAFVTPRPITVAPMMATQQAAVRKQQRHALLLFGSLGVLAAVALLIFVVPFFFPAREAPRAHARTLVAAPGTIFRYFPGVGGVAALPGPVLKFPAAGKVTRIAKPGSAIASGDVLAAVEPARALLNQLAQQRERLAFYQQIAEAMRQVGNTDEEQRQAATVEARKARIAKTLRALAQVAVVASGAGEVEEVFAREGDTVEAGSLAMRLRSAGHRATFEMPRSQAVEARRLGLCQVGVESLVLDCIQMQERGDETHVTVDIPSLPPVLMGRPARLARARFDGAVALPISAILGAGHRLHVLLVSPLGRVEARPVTLAEENVAEAIVIQGLDPGDNVIVEPSSELRPGMHVAIKH